MPKCLDLPLWDSVQSQHWTLLPPPHLIYGHLHSEEWAVALANVWPPKSIVAVCIILSTWWEQQGLHPQVRSVCHQGAAPAFLSSATSPSPRAQLLPCRSISPPQDDDVWWMWSSHGSVVLHTWWCEE